MPAVQDEVPAWLRANDLGQYTDKFMEHGYDDLEVLCELTGDDFSNLEKLTGIKAGHAVKLRIRLRRARGAATNTTRSQAAKRSPPVTENEHAASSKTAKKSRTEDTEHGLKGPSGGPASSLVEGAQAYSTGGQVPESSAPPPNENLACKEPALSNRRLSAQFSPVSAPQMMDMGVRRNAHSDGEDVEGAAWDDNGDYALSPPSVDPPDGDDDGVHSLHANDDATTERSAYTLEKVIEPDEGTNLDAKRFSSRKRRKQDKPEQCSKRHSVSKASATLPRTAPAETLRDDSGLAASTAMPAAAAGGPISTRLKSTVHDVANLWPQETTCIQLHVRNPLFAGWADSSRHHLIQMCASDDAQRQLLANYCHAIESRELPEEDAGIKFFPAERKAELQQIVKELRKQIPTQAASWGTAASGKRQLHRAVFGIRKRATCSMCDMRKELLDAFFNDPRGLNVNAYDREVLWCLHVLEALQPSPWIRIHYSGSNRSQVADNLNIPQTVKWLKIDVLQAAAAAASLPDRSGDNIYRQPCYCLWRVVSAALPKQLGPRVSLDWAPGLCMLKSASDATRERRQREGQDTFALSRGQEQTLCRKVATKLFPYQKSNLAFLLQRERHDVRPAVTDPLWCKLRTHGGQDFWFEPTEGFVSTIPPKDVSPPIRGGMLADEMGLGKTAVTIALAHLHPRPSDYTAPNEVYEVDWTRSTSTGPVRALRHATTCEQTAFSFKKSDLSRLLRESQAPTHSRGGRGARFPSESQCVFLMVTLGDPSIGVWVGAGAKKLHLPLLQCTCWGLGDVIGRSFATQQQYERVGTIRVNLQGHAIEDFQHWQFWRTPQSRRQTAATLVVCPQALVHQWERQIKMHSREHQKVVVYRRAGNKQQRHGAEKDLVGADWVVTTYDELALLEVDDAPVSIEWWRLVIDEAQTMRDAKLLQKALATKLQAVNRVLLSGTPITIGSTVDDLSPLFKFFGIQPYCDSWFWDEGVKAKVGDGTLAETKRLEKIVGQLMTRTLKTDFSSAELSRMMNVQHEEKIPVKFSKLERCLYEHEVQLLKEKRTTREALRMCCSYPMHWGKADSLAEMCEKQQQIAVNELQMSQHNVLARINERGDLCGLLFEQRRHTLQLIEQAEKNLEEQKHAEMSDFGKETEMQEEVDKLKTHLRILTNERAAAQAAYSNALSFDATRPDVDTHYQKAHAAACLDRMTNSYGHEIVRWTDAMLNPTFELAENAMSATKAAAQATDTVTASHDCKACWDTIQDWSKTRSQSEFDSVKEQVENAGFDLAYITTSSSETGAGHYDKAAIGDERLTDIGSSLNADRATKSAAAASARTDDLQRKGRALPALGTELLVEIDINKLIGEVETELRRVGSKQRKNKRDRSIEQSIRDELEDIKKTKRKGRCFKELTATVTKHINKKMFSVDLERMQYHQKKSTMQVLTLGVDRFRVLKRGIGTKPDLFAQLRDESQFFEDDHAEFFKAMTRKGPNGEDVPIEVTKMALLIERLRLLFKECHHSHQQARKDIAKLSAQVLSSGSKQDVISQLAQQVFDTNDSTKFQPRMWAAYAKRVFWFGSCILRLSDLYFDDIEDGVNSGRWRVAGKQFHEYTTQMEAVLCWIAETPRQRTTIKDAAMKIVSEIRCWKVEFVAQRSAVIQVLQHLHRVHLSFRARATPTMLHRHRHMMAVRAKNAQRATNSFLRYGHTPQLAPTAAASSAAATVVATSNPKEAASAAPHKSQQLRKHPPAWQYEVDDSDGQSGIEQLLRLRYSSGTAALNRAKENCETFSELAQKLKDLQQPVQCTFCQDRLNPGTAAFIQMFTLYHFL